MFQKLWPFNSGSQQNGAPPILNSEDHGVSTKVKPIHASFNKGIPLNMKIIIRGDIRTGKTSVFERLQGLPFRKEHQYRTTDQIQVANIPWQYPHTKDIIKVEIWDVVDKGVQARELTTSTANATLKIDNSPASPKSRAPQGADTAPHAAFALDASTIDVYRNTDGVILIYDVSKPWTFEYVAKTLAQVPTNIPVLLLRNFTDESHSQSIVDMERVEVLMEEHNSERFKLPCAPANLVRHLDTSMKTGLGLQEIHESFGIPFLNVLRETHRKQFDQKTLEIAQLLKQLDSHEQERYTTKQSLQQTREPLSPNVIVSVKKNPVLPAIQTSKLAIETAPRTSSPTSPARKTRNDHTNVDILSPTPLSAQNPAVLFEFNSGKLEEDFFHTADFDSTKTTLSKKTSVPDTDISALSPSVAMEPVNIQGNPMVAEDEDIDGPSSPLPCGDDDDVLQPHQESDVWAPGHVETGPVEHHLFTQAEETRLEEIEEQEEEDDEEEEDRRALGSHHNGDNHEEGGQEYVDASDQSTFETIAPLSLRSHHHDSDVESQHNYPIASAMYYEQEPSGFLEEDSVLDVEPPPSSTTLSTYQEIGDGDDDHRSNPWGSTGNLLEGVSESARKDNDDQRIGQEEKEKNEDIKDTNEAGEPIKPLGVDTRQKEIPAEGPSQVVSVRTESDGGEDGDNGDNGMEGEEEAEISPTADKKKGKKKNKKKGGKRGKS
ncbi:hypothetical protein BG004_000617 [Podila humilis]|nr:hypothetical protein BG004_000617 [Podila humilis]